MTSSALSKRVEWAVIIVTMAVGATMVASSWTIPRGVGNERFSPRNAVDSVPAAIAAQPVFNDIEVGGYLISRQIKPYIDTRLELYGRSTAEAYYKLVDGRDEQAILSEIEKWGAVWTLFPPSNRVNDVMARQSAWCRHFGDDVAVVYIRRDVLEAAKWECANRAR